MGEGLGSGFLSLGSGFKVLQGLYQYSPREYSESFILHAVSTEGIPSKSQVESRKIAVATLLAVGVLSICFGYTLITSLQLDHNFENFFSQDDPRTNVFLAHRERFGTENDFILIGVVNNHGVFNPAMRAKVDSLCKAISQLQYVDSVISPYDYADFAVNMKRKLYPFLLTDPGLLIPDSIRILSDPRYADTFFSTSQPAVSIFVKTEDLLSKRKCDYLADTIPKTTALFAFDEAHHSGRSIGQSGYLKLMESDMIFFMQLSIVLLVLFLWVTYRSFLGYSDTIVGGHPGQYMDPGDYGIDRRACQFNTHHFTFYHFCGRHVRCCSYHG